MIKKLNNKIRKCRKCDCYRDIIILPQPGYFKGKILFIFQNPAYPKNKKSDENLKNGADFDISYLTSLKSSTLSKFINDLGLDWNIISITNIVKCPMKDNISPYDTIIDNCKSYTLLQIVNFEISCILLVGSIAKEYLFSMLSALDLPILTVPHYSHLFRIGDLAYKLSISKVKQFISKYQ
mgnify:CR=1 FL=1